MKVAIMQPTFFPWLGYFHLIASVDKFVMLDDVQLSKQSWQTRNFFRVNNEPTLLSIPVLGSSKSKICEVEVKNLNRFIKKTRTTIKQSYAKYNDLYLVDELFDYLGSELPLISSIAELNICIINYFLKVFNIETEIIKSSELNIDTESCQKIIDILNKLDASEYIATPGSRNYMQQYGLDRFSRQVNFFDYNDALNFTGKEFDQNMCIIDVLMVKGVREVYEFISR